MGLFGYLVCKALLCQAMHQRLAWLVFKVLNLCAEGVGFKPHLGHQSSLKIIGEIKLTVLGKLDSVWCKSCFLDQGC